MGPPTGTFKASQKSPSATEQKLGPCILHLSAHLELSLPSKVWYFMLYFLCINWTGPTPHGELSKPQKIRPIQHELCLTSFQRAASQNIVTKIYRLNMFWSMSSRSFVWVLDACYRCGRPCIMEMSWLLSVTSFCPNGPPFSTVTSLCCLITSSTNAHSSEREAGGRGYERVERWKSGQRNG